MNHFHDTQLAAANTIVSFFAHPSNRHRYGILHALCQSGKTGTFHAVAAEMLARGLVDRVYLLCGSAEVILRAQAHDDAEHYNPEAYTAGTFQILFHQDLRLKRASIRRENALILVDESHMDQDKDQRLCKFALDNGFDFWGTTPKMVTENTYILSISATPYSEISNVYHKVTPNKFIVQLRPGLGYRGVGFYMNNGLIQPTFDIVAEWERFADIVRAKGNCWNLVRTTTPAMATTIERRAAEEGIRVLYYTQDRRDVAITWKERQKERRTLLCLEGLDATGAVVAVTPTEPTIILLKGKLRAGKVVPKEHIGFVWEDSKSPNTDTVVQGLLGRMCGYKFGEWMPAIYVSDKLLDDSRGVLQANALVRHTMLPTMTPKKGRNLGGVRDGSDPTSHDRHPSIPILIPYAALVLPALLTKATTTAAKAAVIAAVRAYIEERELFAVRDWYTEEQVAEFQTAFAAGDVHLRHLTPAAAATADIVTTSHKHFFDSVREACTNNKCPIERVAMDPIATLMVDHSGGDVMVYLNAAHRHPRWMAQQSVDTRIPKTTGDEMFRVRVPDATATAAIVPVCLRANIVASSQALRTQLQSIVEFELANREVASTYDSTAVDSSEREETAKGEDGLIVSREVSGLTSSMMFNKGVYNYVSPADNDVVHICAELTNLLEVRLVATIEPCAANSSCFYVRAITWTAEA